MFGAIRRLKQTKGLALIETAVASLFFVSFVILATTTGITIIDTSRDGRTSGLANEMIRQIFQEDNNPVHGDIARVTEALVSLGYIRSNEDYRLILTVYENNWMLGHIRTGISRHGPNTSVDTKIRAYGVGSAQPGIHIGNNIYHLQSNELMYAVEIYSGQRGSTDVQGGELPFYEFSVIVDEP